ncbi:hypothetical protein So717_03820 [Roseobacter cerasinus]|uniref:Transposase IS110-like N-terminal domain-containing protein n=1 Tax=Roseobacter cerasinus TaxID=2602289 RepID=A0A640VKM1_9RHOB|nr:hypothetical protein So717_03820 [Roseobacter cerasinus]
MKQYAGLNVSLKETSICIVDESGKVLHRGSVATEPQAITNFLSEKAPDLDRVVHESGMLSTWLTRGLDALDVPVVCIDARKALSARLNKSDKADAEGLAQLSRMGWYTQVHIRSEAADRLKTLLGARDRLLRLGGGGEEEFIVCAAWASQSEPSQWSGTQSVKSRRQRWGRWAARNGRS